MIREHLMKAHPARDGAFRWRGDGVSRIEGLSDAVFGFAITLLVVSLEVPRTFDELLVMLAGFPAFAAMFCLLVLIWAGQYRFFRHYGLEDPYTVRLNIVLLFFVVFFIYPLKFLFTTFIALWLGGLGYLLDLPFWMAQAREAQGALRQDQWPMVMVVFGLGYIAVFGVFTLLFRHALRQADALDLDPYERLETRASIREHQVHIAVATSSMALTLGLAHGAGWPPGIAAMLGGFAYMTEWPANFWLARWLNRERRALREREPARATRPGAPSSVPA